MSSIREALKRAERERQARLDARPTTERTAVDVEPAPPREADVAPPAPETPSADLRVVHPSPVRLIEVPIDLGGTYVVGFKDAEKQAILSATS